MIGGIPADNLDMLALLNPITYIDKNDPKFIVIHGEADTVVPNCQSIFFSEALKAQGRLEEFVSVLADNMVLSLSMKILSRK